MGKYTWLEEYCLCKKGARKEYKEEWACFRYMLRDKMFLMDGGDKEGTPILTLKLEPAYGALLRRQYEGDIVPGYYMNKEHWSSVYVGGNVPDSLLRELVDRSYGLVLSSFSKKVQREITEGIA